MADLTKRKAGGQDVELWDGGATDTFTALTSTGRTITLSDVDWMGVDVERVYGARNQASLTAALAAIGTTNIRRMWLAPGNWILESNTTITSNITLAMAPGAYITLGTYNLTLNGPVEAGPYKIFNITGAGVVTFGAANGMESVLPQWWGATGDGVVDDSVAVQSAITSCIASGKTLMFPPGTYLLETGVTVDGVVRMEGLGHFLSVIFKSTGTNTILTLTGNAAYSQLSNINFYGNTETNVGLYLYGCNYAEVTSCRFYDLLIGAKFESEGTNGCWFNSFYKCVFSSNDTSAKFIQEAGATYKPNRNNFVGCKFKTTTAYHVYIEYGDTIEFVKCDFDHAPVMIYSNDADTTFTSCALEGNATGTAIYLRTGASGNHFAFTNCTVSHGSWDLNAATSGYKWLSDTNPRLHRKAYMVEQDSVSDPTFQTLVTDDPVYRFKVQTGGEMEWGTGTDDRDTNMSRYAAGILQAEQTFRIGEFLLFPAQATQTVVAGVITATGTWTVVSSGLGAGTTVDLNTITAPATGAGTILIVSIVLFSEDVVLKHGTGNISLNGSADITLHRVRDSVMLRYTVSDGWTQLAPANIIL